MRLADDWWPVLRYAWSIRFLLIAAGLDGLSSAMSIDPYLLPVPMWAVAGLAGLVSCAAFVSRLVVQRKVP